MLKVNNLYDVRLGYFSLYPNIMCEKMLVGKYTETLIFILEVLERPDWDIERRGAESEEEKTLFYKILTLDGNIFYIRANQDEIEKFVENVV